MNFSDMDSGLAALMGEDEETAFRVLGKPTGQQEFSGDRVYTWTASSTVSMIPGIAAGQEGSVFNPLFGASSQRNCLIKLTANDKGRLITWEYEGNLGGCRSYIGKLDGYAVASGKA